jgi:bacterioferritin-associated ferredoxin
VYACICAAVTDAAVGEAISQGARTPEAIGTATGAGTGCGSCHDHLCDMIQLLTGDRCSAVSAAT